MNDYINSKLYVFVVEENYTLINVVIKIVTFFNEAMEVAKSNLSSGTPKCLCFIRDW